MKITCLAAKLASSIAFLLLFVSPVFAQLDHLQVEVYASHDGLVGDADLTGYKTYRVYAVMTNPNDYLSSCSGNIDCPIFFSTTTSFFQSEFGGLFGTDINSALYEIFPETEFDSWITLGRESSDSPGGPINMATADSEWQTNFENGGDLILNDAAGTIWFALNGDVNGLAGDDLKVLVAQFTTDGQIDMERMNLSVWAFGVNTQSELTCVTDWEEFGFESCHDEEACNYDPLGEVNNDLCCYGVCGCIDDSACNFNPNADCSDFSCEWGTCFGCTDDGTLVDSPFPGIQACNYSPEYTVDSGDCDYECHGCTDETACNYLVDATIENGSCCFGNCHLIQVSEGSFGSEILWQLKDQDGNLVAEGGEGEVYTCIPDGCYVLEMSDAFGDGWGGGEYFIYNELDELLYQGDIDNPDYGDGLATGIDLLVFPNETVDCFLLGCGDPIACNYNEEVTFDDGSCDYLDCAGCIDNGDLEDSPFPGSEACNYDPSATTDDGSCDYSCLGCTDPEACNFSETATIDAGDCCFGECFRLSVGGGVWDNEILWEIKSISADLIIYEGLAGDYDICLDPTDCYEFIMLDSFGDGWSSATYEFEQEGTIFFTGTLDEAEHLESLAFGIDYLTFETSSCEGGCLDDGNLENSPFPGIAACNYDPSVDFDNASCEYAECIGCLDPNASNYSSEALIDSENCIYCDQGFEVLKFEMYDEFGDGWNNATYTIFDSSLEIVGTGSLNDASVGDGLSYGWDEYCLPFGCYTVEISAGNIPQEISWEISDYLGNAYGGLSAPNGIPEESFPFDFGFSQECTISGCTNPVCFNYNLNANEDDGTCICPPDNDLICDAAVLTCGMEVNGTTINASDSEDLIGTTCVDQVTQPGVWYIYSSDEIEQVTLSTCNSVDSESQIAVYSATDCAGELICVETNQVECGFHETVDFESEAGTDYYIYISRFADLPGIDFTLNINCGSCLESPLNDDCDQAMLIFPGDTLSAIDCCAGPTEFQDCAEEGTTIYDTWYVVGPSDFTELILQITNTNSPLIGVSVYSTPTACDELELMLCCTPFNFTCEINNIILEDLNTQNAHYIQLWTSEPGECVSYDLTLSGGVVGCMNPDACNYNPDANLNSMDCIFEPILTVSDDVEICLGDEVEISAESDYPLEWMNLGSENSYDVMPTETTVYEVSSASGEDCEVFASVTVTVNVPPAVTFTISENNTLTSDVIGESYQWYIDGVEIPGANQSSYEISEDGEYSLVVTFEDGCSSESEWVNVVFVSIQNQNLQNQNIEVFPNPMTSQTLIQFDCEAISEVRIIGTKGDLVSLKKTVSENGVLIERNELSAGLYLIKVYCGGKFIGESKLMVE